MPGTPLGTTVLALLNERDMHPYEMFQLLQQRRRDRLVKLRAGSLYHAVGRLEAAELIVAVATERDGNRPERTTYAITDAGRTELRARVGEALERSVREFPQFPLALSEAHNLHGEEVVQRLTARIALLEGELADLDTFRATMLELDKPRAYWIEVDYRRAVTRTEIEWLRATVDELASGTLPWVVPETDTNNRAQAAAQHTRG
ncbi:PadR family transcriptional regulator [Rhodococcus triatomae]|nr:PadR-like family transcriptional regulator [Rhodococcus triatomae BKS 15-14]